MTCTKCGKKVQPDQLLAHDIFCPSAPILCRECFDKTREEDPPIRVFVLNKNTDFGELMDSIKIMTEG